MWNRQDLFILFIFFLFMQYSVGVDIVDVDDFKRRISRTRSLAERLFTKNEIEYCKKRGVEHLASRFAAKEALVKALNFKAIEWHDVEVKNSESGKPYFKIKKELKKKLGIKSIDLSISNTKRSAVAVVMVGR